MSPRKVKSNASSPEMQTKLPYFTELKAKTRSLSSSSSPGDHPIGDLERYAMYLPEPQRELYHKLFRLKLTTFTCFPDLPIELRLKIWRLMFPEGQEIHICIESRKVEERSTGARGTGLPAPITLFINRESRYETLRHYHIFSQADIFDVQAPYNMFVLTPKAFCINPARDKISFPFYLASYSIFAWFVEFMTTAAPACMSKVRSIEIRDFYLSPHLLLLNANNKFGPMMLPSLMKFRHLEEVHFVGCKNENIEPSSVRIWKEKVKQCYEWEKEVYPECRVPKITCLSWKVWEAMKFLAGENRP